MNQRNVNPNEDGIVLIVPNPAAGRGSQSDLLVPLQSGLKAAGIPTEMTHGLDDLRQRFAAPHAASKLRSVVAVGGDGTVAAIANITQGQVPIAIAPTGTENLLATRLGLSRDAGSLVNMIQHGTIQRLDVGRVNGRIFLIMFSCGFDAEVVRRLHEGRRGPISRWSYTRPILATLKSYRYPPMTIDCRPDNGEPCGITLQGHWAFAFNLNCYARGLRIAPQADPTDGKFDLCVLRSPSRLSGLFHFLTVATRCQGEWSGFQQLRCARLRVESPEQVPFQIDGEPGGYLPADLDVLPQWISLLGPSLEARPPR